MDIDCLEYIHLFIAYKYRKITRPVLISSAKFPWLIFKRIKDIQKLRRSNGFVKSAMYKMQSP